MINFLCFCLGLFTIVYEVIIIDTNILFQYSGWFVIFTSLLHFWKMCFSMLSSLAYVAISIGMLIVFPASVPSLMFFERTFTSYLLYGIGGHIVLPLCTIFHLDKTTYSEIHKSILFLLLYNTFWVFVVEYFSVKKPYEFLDTLVIEYRVLSYIIVSIIGTIGLLIISILPCITRYNTINI